MANYGSPIRDAMLDASRADFGMRVGKGKALFIRAGARLAQLFPDGCKIQVERSNGQLMLTLRNRATGRAWSELGDGTVSINMEQKALETSIKIEQFGSVSPERVEQVSGAVVVYLPKELPSKQTRTFTKAKPKAVTAVRPAAAQAVQPRPAAAPAVAARTATEPKAAAPMVRTPSVGAAARPQVDLRTAVEAINAWKALDGDNLTLGIGADGRLTALAQFS